MPLGNYLSPHLFWALTVGFVALPAALFLWTAVLVERSRNPAGAGGSGHPSSW
jgi:hypothetical protein